MRRLALFAIALSALSAACDAPEPLGEPAHAWKQWEDLPVEMHVSVALGDCEQASLAAAESYLETRAHRELLSPRTVPADALSVSGQPAYGVVAVAPSPGPARPGALDQVTQYATSDGKRMHSAIVELGACNPRAYAHELGHALGLGHAGRGRLMAEVHDGDAWTLDDGEVAEIVGRSPS